MKRNRLALLLGGPPLWQLAVLLGVGLVLLLCAHIYARSCRPEELSSDIAAVGLRRVNEVLRLVAESDFGRSSRGAVVTAAAVELVSDGRVRFSPNMAEEALYRKEFGRPPVLYISVFCHGKRVMWPRPAELAERICHESLHTVVQSRDRSKEEECDAFCAAEEASAAVGQRSPRYPVMRDGRKIWDWIQEVYSNYPSDREYDPIGYTLQELSVRTGIAY
jgi:hypothetical protein